MDNMQKRSLIIIVNSIEQQLSSLRQLLMLSAGDDEPVHKVHKQRISESFTNQQEDDMIAQALQVDERDALMQDIFKQAGPDGEQRK